MTAMRACLAASASALVLWPTPGAWLPGAGAGAPPFLRCALLCCAEVAAEAGAAAAVPAMAFSTREATMRVSVSFDLKYLWAQASPLLRLFKGLLAWGTKSAHKP